MEEGELYLSGNLDFGVAMCNIAVFKNKKKEKENQPDFYIVTSRKISGRREIKRIGALWKRKKKGEKEEEKAKDKEDFL